MRSGEGRKPRFLTFRCLLTARPPARSPQTTTPRRPPFLRPLHSYRPTKQGAAVAPPCRVFESLQKGREEGDKVGKDLSACFGSLLTAFLERLSAVVGWLGCIPTNSYPLHGPTDQLTKQPPAGKGTDTKISSSFTARSHRRHATLGQEEGVCRR